MNNDNQWKRKTAAFMSAQTISLLGSSLVQYAIIWYITLSTSSGIYLTISTICGFAPQILISLFAGAWADKYDRKKMIMLADSAIALSTLILAILFMSGYKEIWLLFLVLIVRAAGTGIQAPCVNAIIPQLVPKEKLMRISGINSTISSLIMFLSPALSGAILSFFSLEITLLIDVATAIIGVSITSGIAITSYKTSDSNGESLTEVGGSLQKKKSALDEIKAGFAYLKEKPFVTRLLLFQLSVLFLISPAAFLMPLMVSRSFGPEIWRLTATEMTYSAGAALGGILITAWGGFKSKMNTTILAGAAYGLFMIAMGVSPYFVMFLAFNLMVGVTAPCYNSPITVMIQENVEQGMQGRVFSFMQIATSCALPLGMAIFGPLSDFVSIQAILICAGAMVLIITLFNLFKKRSGV